MKSSKEERNIVLKLYFPGDYNVPDMTAKESCYPYKKTDIQSSEYRVPYIYSVNYKEQSYDEEHCNWYDVKTIFRSCGIEGEELDQGVYNDFEYDIFYPLCPCISIMKRYSCKEDAKQDAKRILCDYQRNNPEVGIDEPIPLLPKPIWTIFDKPIVWIQSDYELSHYTEESDDWGIILFSKSTIPDFDMEYVILLCVLLLSYSSQVKLKMKNVFRESKKSIGKDELKKIHDYCALFNNLYYHPNPCHNEEELIGFERLKKKLRMKNISNQIINAKEILDYRNEIYMAFNTASLNRIAFITGYIGVLFALFSFCGLSGTDIFDFYHPIKCGFWYFVLLLLIGVTFVSSISGLIYFYDHYIKCALKRNVKKKKILVAILIFVLIIVWGFLFVGCCKLFMIAR